ncbi:MAG: hypothetical protein ABUK11_03755 [Mariprofundaceae bacterium]
MVVTIGAGVVTAAEVLESECSLLTEPGFEISFNQLVDFGQATKLISTGSDMKYLADIAPWGDGSRRAAVMPDKNIFGLARMYEVYNERNGSDWHVFKTMEEALAWLGEGDHSKAVADKVML